MSIIWMEIKRFFSIKQFWVLSLVKTMSILLVTAQYMTVTDNTIWIIVPFLSICSTPLYQRYLQKNAIEAAIYYSDRQWILLKTMFWVLSLLLNLPIALMIGYITKNPYWLCYWFVLDILGLLFHCIYCTFYEVVGYFSAYLLIIPTAYPWVMLGIIVSEGNVVMLKLLGSFWMFLSSMGIFFYLFCFRAGCQT